MTGFSEDDAGHRGFADPSWRRLSLGLVAAIVGGLLTMGLHPAVPETAADEEAAGGTSDDGFTREQQAPADTLVLTGGVAAGPGSSAGPDPSVACPVVVMERLRYVFRWHLDFPDGLRPGDSFRAVLLASQPSLSSADGGGKGPERLQVLGAEIETRGHSTRAVGYRSPDGGNRRFFAPDGTQVGASRIPTPDGFRMTSRFNRGRVHPVLRERRPHLGVDYAVPYGEVVRAVTAGRVSRVERDPGLGLVVQIQHDAHRSTRYAHLSSVEPGITPGRLVRAGEPVGRAGATGLATAPHLHFEFLMDGQQRNPLAQHSGRLFPSGPSIDQAAFAAQTDPIVELLESRTPPNPAVGRVQLAVRPEPGTTAGRMERMLRSATGSSFRSGLTGRSLPRWPLPPRSGWDPTETSRDETKTTETPPRTEVVCSLSRASATTGRPFPYLVSADGNVGDGGHLPVWDNGLAGYSDR